jgi:short-subunit dehydrogenase
MGSSLSMELRGKIAIITGASSGIGRTTARTLAARGATVVAVARRERRLADLIEECRHDSPRSTYLCGDLAERSFAESAIARTVEQFGRLDVLINNAATPKHKSIFDTSVEEAERVMQINFLSPLWLTMAALGPMLSGGGGTIVNVSSLAGRITPPRESIYAASKAALNAFTMGLEGDLAGSNIHVGLVIPGAIDTEIWHRGDESPSFDGRKHPPEVVTRAILEVIEHRKAEVHAPRIDPPVLLARFLRACFPNTLRRGLARSEPAPTETLEHARLRARRGHPVGSTIEAEDPLAAEGARDRSSPA